MATSSTATSFSNTLVEHLQHPVGNRNAFPARMLDRTALQQTGTWRNVFKLDLPAGQVQRFQRELSPMVLGMPLVPSPGSAAAVSPLRQAPVRVDRGR